MAKRLKKKSRGWEMKWKIKVYQGAAFNAAHSTRHFKMCVVHIVSELWLFL